MSLLGLLFGAKLGGSIGKGIGNQINVSSYRSTDKGIKQIEAEYDGGDVRFASMSPWKSGFVECTLRTNYVRSNGGQPIRNITEAVKQRVDMVNKLGEKFTYRDDIINILINLRNNKLPEEEKTNTITVGEIRGSDVMIAIKKWKLDHPYYSAAWSSSKNP